MSTASASRRRTLKEGDIVTLGKSEFRFVDQAGAGRATQERGG